MKKIRIGNDITIRWTINRQGEPEDFSGKSASVYLLEPFSNTSASINYTIEGNVITIYFNGKDQKKTGQYTLKLVENEGKAGMITLDICNPFTLVSKSCMAGGYGECSNVDVETIELTSSLDVGKDGKSAYEIALSEGFEGTEAEWLASLKGEKGDTGSQGPKGEKGDTGSKGDTGEPFTYDMFTEEQLESLRGPKGEQGEQGMQGLQGEKGDKGDAFTYEDFTTEQLAALKGEKGEKGDTYDDTEVRNTISSLQNALNALVGGDVTTAIDNFNEVIAFLKGIEDSQDLASIIASIERQIAAKQASISDLEAIRAGAAKGATALQSYTETDPTVPAWAKAATKPTYTASEVGLGNVGNFKSVSTVANQGLTATEKTNARNNIGAGTSSFSGSYDDLSNKPTIPTKVSELTNDAGYTGNVGTITGIKMNGVSKGTSGVVNLGNVITGDGSVTEILKVPSLPTNVNSTTMYLIP